MRIVVKKSLNFKKQTNKHASKQKQERERGGGGETEKGTDRKQRRHRRFFSFFREA